MQIRSRAKLATIITSTVSGSLLTGLLISASTPIIAVEGVPINGYISLLSYRIEVLGELYYIPLLDGTQILSAILLANTTLTTIITSVGALIFEKIRYNKTMLALLLSAIILLPTNFIALHNILNQINNAVSNIPTNFNYSTGSGEISLGTAILKYTKIYYVLSILGSTFMVVFSLLITLLSILLITTDTEIEIESQ